MMTMLMNTAVAGRLARGLCMVGLLAVLAGCATQRGRDFPLARVNDFVLGQSTRQQVAAVFGPPLSEEVVTFKKDMADHVLEQPSVTRILTYDYAETQADKAVVPGVRPQRRALMYFADDRLVGYFRLSSFKADATDFRLERADDLRKGETREDEVIARIGEPAGRGIYPMAAQPGGRALFYNQQLVNSPAGSTTRKELRVFLSPQGVVEDFTASSTVTAIPLAPAPTVIPVYIPRGR